MDTLIALDAGGSYVKATAFDLTTGQSRTCGESVPLVHPAPGFNERDPEALWVTAAQCIRRVLAEVGGPPSRVLGVGLTGHGNGVYLVDGGGRPTRHAILASDSRAAELVRRWVAEGAEAALRARAWSGLWAGMTGPGLAWLARHERDTLSESAAVLGCKDYLRARLTGKVATDVSQATSNGLYDNSPLARDWTLSRLQPNDEALRTFGLADYSWLLPETVDPFSTFEVSAQAAAACGLPAGTPVVAGLVDNPATQHGSGVFDSTSICVGAGTWSINQLLVPASEMVTDGSLGRVGPYAAALGLGGQGLLCEASATSAATFAWALERAVTATARDDAREGRDPYAARLEREGRRRRREDDPLFLPFIDGSRAESGARGAWIGLSSATDEADLLGAVLEGICLEHRRHIGRLESALDARLPIRLSGGASRSPLWCQLFADVLARPVSASPLTELGSVCAAAIAGVAVGVFASVPEGVERLNSEWVCYEPQPLQADHRAHRWQLYQRWAAEFDHAAWGVVDSGS